MLEDVLVLWRRLLLRFADDVARTSESMSMVGGVGECWVALMPRSHNMQRAVRCNFIAIAGQIYLKCVKWEGRRHTFVGLCELRRLSFRLRVDRKRFRSLMLCSSPPPRRLLHSIISCCSQGHLFGVEDVEVGLGNALMPLVLV